MKSITLCGGIIVACLVTCAGRRSSPLRSGKVSKRVSCYACKSDSSFSFDNKCLFPSDASALTICSEEAKFCQADFVTVMGVFNQFERRCADECGETCISKGYGAPTETCTYCCENKEDCGLEEHLQKQKKWKP